MLGTKLGRSEGMSVRTTSPFLAADKEVDRPSSLLFETATDTATTNATTKTQIMSGYKHRLLDGPDDGAAGGRLLTDEDPIEITSTSSSCPSGKMRSGFDMLSVSTKTWELIILSLSVILLGMGGATLEGL